MIETKPCNLLLPYFEAGYPAVALETCEESRIIESCISRGDDWHNVFSIAASGGLMDEKLHRVMDGAATFPKAFQHISSKDESLLLVFDFQHMINSATAYRGFLQSFPMLKSRGSMIVLVAPSWNLPAELKHELPVVRLPLPTESELNSPLKVVQEQLDTPPGFSSEEFLSSARGLTLSEAENVFALSGRMGFSREIVENEKMRIVKSSYMSVEKPCDPSSLAGLGRLKSYITEEVIEAKFDDLLRVRGILLVGVPGTGKSLSSKVIASLLGWPLVRIDVSACKGSLMGQSESNIRNGLAMADAVSPCVLWFDEIEKAVGGFSSSGHTDGGTTLAMVGTILTWMQEHTTPVLVVATCNDFSKLPVELTRAGRFDEKFFLDLPSMSERNAIAKVHLTRLNCATKWDVGIGALTVEWTGAEIEQLIKSAARRTKRELNSEVLKACASEIIPISKSSKIQELREWAKTHLRVANDLDMAETVQRRVKKEHGGSN